MPDPTPPKDVPGRPLRAALILTWIGLAAERLIRALWPLWTAALFVLGVLFLGLHDSAPVEVVWVGTLLSLAAAAFGLWHAARHLRLPSRSDASERLDASLPGRPLAALADTQAIGAGDAASEAVWQAHRRRMQDRLAGARAVRPDLQLARFDRFGLRYVALTVFAVALLFGSIWRVETLGGMAPGAADAMASGPSWEGWVEPPVYTGRPSLYLNDIAPGPLSVPQGSEVIVRLYGEAGALSVSETVSGAPLAQAEPAASFNRTIAVNRSGTVSIEGPGGASWNLSVLPDGAPQISFEGPLTHEASGEMSQAFTARDDYGVTSGRVEITLDLAAVDRRLGLAAEPDPREPLVVDLPLPFTGDRSEFTETLVENFSKHPWANLPVEMRLYAEDAAGGIGSSPLHLVDPLPGRRFFAPLASAIIEQRRDLLWSETNGARVAQVLRAVSHRPEGFFRSETNYLRMRVAIRRLESAVEFGFGETARDEIAEALWDLAVLIEEGDLSNAMERLRRAQDRLAEAIRNGATDEEIAELMQELREAMQDYMRQLAEQQRQDGQEMAESDEMQEITGDQLQDMLDRLQQLMEEGRTAEAQQLLEQLRRMMENMQIAQGEQGGQPSPGQQAMRGLQETLREQQGLSDDSFQELQDQFNQPGQQPGQQPGEGQQGGQGQGQQQFGQGQQQGGQQRPGQPGQGMDGMSLADRQDALRDMLRQQQEGLPGGGEAADAARDALDRAGRAMEDAEQALREDDLAGALDSQSEAMDELREGMRNLGEELANQQQQQGQGQEGEAFGQAQPGQQRDPLGRNTGSEGELGTREQMLQGEDVYRRARDLLDEIRRRSADQTRPDVELEYLRRLLERF